jgi:transposase
MNAGASPVIVPLLIPDTACRNASPVSLEGSASALPAKPDWITRRRSNRWNMQNAVTPADVQDRNMIAPLLAIACKRFPSIEKAIADGGFQGKATADDVQDQAGIPLEIVKRSDVIKGFVLLPKRWIVERTYGWLGRCRRLAKDYENLTRSHVGFIILAMIRLMLRRIVRLQGAS